MFLEILSHEYFWLSFLPITLLGAGFWILYFDRSDEIKEPIGFLFLALLAGIFSATTFTYASIFTGWENFLWKIAGEEFSKVLFATLLMELLHRRFRTITQGIMYGFAVGIGFSCAENILYLATIYNNVQGFDANFWLAFQGRFWSSSLLHGVTTAFFGLFYGGTYLSKTLRKARNESPLRAFFVPPNLLQFWYILTLHVARNHLLFKQEKTISMVDHEARTVVLEGLWIAILVHTIFNTALDFSKPIFAFVIAFGGMIFLAKFAVKD